MVVAKAGSPGRFLQQRPGALFSGGCVFFLLLLWSSAVQHHCRPHPKTAMWQQSRQFGLAVATAFVPPQPLGAALVRRSSTATRSNPWFSTTTAKIRTTRPRYFSLNAKKKASTTTAATKTTKTTKKKKDGRKTDYHLVIVESPTKCLTLSKILNDGRDQSATETATATGTYYEVAASVGHVRNLLKKKEKREKQSSSSSSSNNSKFPYSVPGIDLENDYRPTYEILPSQVERVGELQRLASGASRICLATDPDREGEAIAWHLTELLGDSNNNTEKDTNNDPHPPAQTYVRWRLQEITPAAVHDAIALAAAQQQEQEEERDPTTPDPSPSSCLNIALVRAQETRRILDRLVGFTVSPVLLRLLSVPLSAGRVQSVALALVVDRERERLRFVVTPYSGLQAQLQVPSETTANAASSASRLVAGLQSINGQPVALTGRDFEPTGLGLTQQSSHKMHLKREGADALVEEFLNDNDSTWSVVSVESRRVVQRPPQPFRTSTLQQSASTQLGLPVQRCMQVAQQLYQAGYISYMRTDATHLSDEADATARAQIAKLYGNDYVNHKDDNEAPGKTKKKTKKSVKFAQDAHEAIRPALLEQQANGNSFPQPQQLELVPELTPAHVDLYRLIYRRTLASQMTPQVSNATRVVVQAESSSNTTTTLHFTVTGRVVLHDGYTAAWKEDEDDDSNNNNDSQQQQQEARQVLPPLVAGQVLDLKDLCTINHETQPPARFNEASLVRKLEELGVGRPSTYASTVQILRDRAYVVSSNPNGDNNRFGRRTERTGSAMVVQRAAGGMDLSASARGPLVPSLPAFCVTELLQQHCPVLVDPEFTAGMEAQLDQIANNQAEVDPVGYLDEFYAGPDAFVAQVKRMEETVPGGVARRVTLPALQQQQENEESTVGVFIGPWGPYVQEKSGDGSNESLTASLPPHMAANLSLITPPALQALLSAKRDGGIAIGQHPDDGRNIRLKTGRFGPFLQWGDDGQTNTTTHSLPKGKKVMADVAQFVNNDGSAPSGNDDSMLGIGISFEEAVGYVSLPRTVSTLNGLPITAAIGPYGPYLKYNSSYVNLKDTNILDVDADTANQLVTEEIILGNKSKRSGRGVLAELGEKDGIMVTVKTGRYGDYINWKNVNAKMPAQYADEPTSVPLDEAWTLIQEKAGKKLPAKKGQKERKGSTKKDSNVFPPAPKRPISAYLHFCAEKRPEVSASGKSLGETSKTLASLWAETAAKERKRYEEMAMAGKADYEAKKIAWEEECQRLTGESPRAPSPSPPPTTKTTRSPSAYVLFCREYRPTIVDDDGNKLSFGETAKRLAELWKQCDDESRLHFVEQAAKEKQKLLTVKPS